MAERGKYWYNYHEYLFSSFMVKFCCCFKKRACYKRKLAKLERHEQASARLESELDINNIIYVHRLSKFMAKITLKKQ